MDYHEAAEIARKNPGAVLTRDAFGSFVVRLLNGTVVGAEDGNTVMDGLLRERDALLEELSQVHADLAAREEQLQSEIAALRSTCAKLQGVVSAARCESLQLSQQLEALRTEKMALETRLSKVSDSEWERIREEDRLQREAEAVQRKAERRVVQCACSGEVENCARCFGAGEYVVDGYGNPE